MLDGEDTICISTVNLVHLQRDVSAFSFYLKKALLA